MEGLQMVKYPKNVDSQSKHLNLPVRKYVDIYNFGLRIYDLFMIFKKFG